MVTVAPKFNATTRNTKKKKNVWKMNTWKRKKMYIEKWIMTKKIRTNWLSLLVNLSPVTSTTLSISLCISCAYVCLVQIIKMLEKKKKISDETSNTTEHNIHLRYAIFHTLFQTGFLYARANKLYTWVVNRRIERETKSCF